MRAKNYPTLFEAGLVWARIALLSFGGPAGQIALMHRILIDEKRWIGEKRFLHALNFCMLLPGPEAQQLAIYIGWLMNGRRGGVIAGVLFIIPGAICLLALSILFVLFGHLPAFGAVLLGLKAAVLVLVCQAFWRILSRSLTNNLLRIFAAISFFCLFFLAVPFPVVVMVAFIAGILAVIMGFGSYFEMKEHHIKGGNFPADADSVLGDGADTPDKKQTFMAGITALALWLVSLALFWALLDQGAVFRDMALLFSKMAVVTFGGAYAVLTYVAQEAVEKYHWLTPDEMMIGLGMAETTPGPLILVLEFVGFVAAFREYGSLWAGIGGAFVTLWMIFTPSFAFIFLGAPFIERLRHNKAISAALTAVTAAVVGVVLNLALWFALHVLFRDIIPLSWGGLSFNMPRLASVDITALLLVVPAFFAAFGLRLNIGWLLALCMGAGWFLSLALS